MNTTLVHISEYLLHHFVKIYLLSTYPSSQKFYSICNLNFTINAKLVSYLFCFICPILRPVSVLLYFSLALTCQSVKFTFLEKFGNKKNENLNFGKRYWQSSQSQHSSLNEIRLFCFSQKSQKYDVFFFLSFCVFFLC